MSTSERNRSHWRGQVRRTLVLLVIWAIVGFGMSILFVEELNQLRIGTMPFGFWMAQQGSIFVFILLILIYAVLSGRADRAMRADDLRPVSEEDITD